MEMTASEAEKIIKRRSSIPGNDESYDMIDTAYDKAIEALQLLEKQENGLLVELPCKVGDTVYRIDTDPLVEDKEIETFTIDNIVICSDGEIGLKYDAFDGVICYIDTVTKGIPYLDYYLAFLTREEAEKGTRSAATRIGA